MAGVPGGTHALLGVEGQASDLLDLLDADGLQLLWHPSLAERELWPGHRAVVAGREHLTVLCVEGSVLAMGACAGYGGWPAQPPTPAARSGCRTRWMPPGGRCPPGGAPGRACR